MAFVAARCACAGPASLGAVAAAAAPRGHRRVRLSTLEAARSPSPSPPEHFERFAFALTPAPRPTTPRTAPRPPPLPTASTQRRTRRWPRGAAAAAAAQRRTRNAPPGTPSLCAVGCRQAVELLRLVFHDCFIEVCIGLSESLHLGGRTIQKKDLVYSEVLVWCNSCLRLLCSMVF